MKKFTLIIICFILMPFLVFAADKPFGFSRMDDTSNAGSLEEPYDIFVEEPFGDDPLDIGAKKPFVVGERNFEIGIANINFNFANTFLTAKQIFQETLTLDMRDLADGFRVNLGVNVTPFYVSFKSKKGWSGGFFIDVNAIGILNLSGNMLSFNEAKDDISDVSGALFASATAKSSFNIQKFKVRFNPSLFYTLAYVQPESVKYNFTQKDGGTVMYVDYNIQAYTGFPIDGSDFALTAKPGFDFSAGVSYPLSEELGINRKFPFLEFDVGVDFINIPLVSSKMSNLMQMKDYVGIKDPLFFTDDFMDNLDVGGENSEPVYSVLKEAAKMYRPFKMLISADWRPFYGSKLIRVEPVFGFSINTLYSKPFSIEAGINGTVNLANLFRATLGFNYMDRMHVYSLDLAFNLRAFELNLGADLRSQTVAKAWTAAGVGIDIGLKFGW